MAAHQGYYNFPDIHGETIVFACEGDLWTVPVAGGLARRLTSDPGAESWPNFSPDGATIAFTGAYSGNADVYTIPSEGGTPKRLTWHPYGDSVMGWTPDGKTILHMTRRRDAFGWSLYGVPAEGGPPELFPVGEAGYSSIHPDGNRIVFNRLNRSGATWKRYLGGTQDDVWFGDSATGEFRKLTSFPGHDAHPMWVGERIVFVSERDGRRNLWSLDAEGAGLTQHTSHRDFDVRYPGTDNQDRVVYQHGADIRLFTLSTGTDEVVPIEVASERAIRAERFASAAQYLESFALSPKGDRIAVTARGEFFNLPTDTGLPIALAANAASREKDAVFGGKEGESVFFTSDRSGEEELYRINARKAGDPVCLSCGQEGLGSWRFPLAVTADGKRAAWADQVGTLRWMDTEKKDVKTVDDSDIWEIDQYEWSPDGQFLAYAKYEPNIARRIYIHDADAGENHPVTDGFYDSWSPSWDPKGDYLFFLSGRTFDPVFDAQDFNAIMGPMTRPYMALLRKDSENPFLEKDPYEEAEKEKTKKDENKDKPSKKDAKADKKKGKDDKKDKPAKDGGEEEPEPVDVKIDWEGLENRQVAVEGVNAADIRSLSAVEDRLLYLVDMDEDDEGEDAEHSEKPQGGITLMALDYKKERKREPKTFAENVRGYTLSGDFKRIALRQGDAILVGGVEGDKFDAESDETDHVNLGAARLRVNPPLEWSQIWREAFRLYRDFFYTADMAGVDWEGEWNKYTPLLDRVSTRGELNDVIGALIGEMGHGHTYLWSGGDPGITPRPPIETGMIGADLKADLVNDCFIFERVLRGEPWDPDMQTPLGQPHLDVKEGEYLLEVNGQRVSATRDPYSYFWGLSDVDITLTVNSKPTTKGARHLRVHPESSEGSVRYHEWVEHNRAYVAEKTEGAIGYVHLPDMGMPGLIEFNRQWFRQLKTTKGIIVDTRYNGGGFVSSLLIERMRRIFQAYGAVRNFKDDTIPYYVPPPAMVMLTNESA
ncbi:PDZ domain-containing protein, partial [Candidatus Poribacteria bacterium]|nr:PDZ domain-containing protein [Candidatus Poribacteria bacterium]